MKKIFSKHLLTLIAFIGVSFGMDSNGVFIGAGYQQGVAQMQSNINKIKERTNTEIQGFGVMLGYQFFFGKYLGLRAYGFFDYAHADSVKLKNPKYKAIPQVAQKAGLSSLSNKLNPPTFEPNMLTYGGAADLMLNFINNGIMSLGVFGGVQFAGNSWIMANPSFEGIINAQTRLSKKATSFQFLFNVGARLRILKHSSIEGGVKFPMLKNPFITAKNMDLSFRRVYSWYVNYVFTF
ncbi:outer membrane protein [Helicobacter cetorum]|uniref:outer membrane protein n=1 Tax=Helicobacter cetorum TaxID=138563 RepID=UPI000CF17FDE|nr:outer membrane protein [Helicobacter cetorum]